MNKKEVLQNLVLRNPLLRPQNLHYKGKKLRNKITEAPKPLSFPLHPLPPEHKYMTQPLGPINVLPFNVR